MTSLTSFKDGVNGVVGHSDPALAGEESEKRMKRAAEPKVKYGTDKSDSSVFPQKAGLPQNDRRAKCFFVPADEIRANKYDLSISRYKEIEHKEIGYEKPEVIIGKVMKFETEIAAELKSLQSMIKGNL